MQQDSKLETPIKPQPQLQTIDDFERAVSTPGGEKQTPLRDLQSSKSNSKPMSRKQDETHLKLEAEDDNGKI